MPNMIQNKTVRKAFSLHAFLAFCTIIHLSTKVERRAIMMQHVSFDNIQLTPKNTMISYRSQFLPHKLINWTVYQYVDKWHNDPQNEHEGNIAFVHVGKAGGSTVRCYIYKALHPEQCHKKWLDFPALANLYIPEVCHVRCPRSRVRTNIILINLRHPITRFISAFYFDKKIFGDANLYKCFQDVNDLFENGLVYPPSKLTGNNTTSSSCSNIAWNVTKGIKNTISVRGYSDIQTSHMVRNYGVYQDISRKLYSKENGDFPNVIGLRIEHLMEDMEHLSSFITTGSASRTTVTSLSHDKDSSFGININTQVNDTSIKTISKHGLENACRALCKEIQHYKNFLYRSENFDTEMIEQSIHELQEACPEESYAIRQDCV